MDEKRFCVACRWHEELDRAHWTTDRHRCVRRSVLKSEPDLVTGERRYTHDNCYAQRRSSSDPETGCGSEGHWWEPSR